MMQVSTNHGYLHSNTCLQMNTILSDPNIRLTSDRNDWIGAKGFYSSGRLAISDLCRTFQMYLSLEYPRIQMCVSLEYSRSIFRYSLYNYISRIIIFRYIMLHTYIYIYLQIYYVTDVFVDIIITSQILHDVKVCTQK